MHRSRKSHRMNSKDFITGAQVYQADSVFCKHKITQYINKSLRMMVRCGLVTCLLLLAMIDVGEASENLGPECFDCRCPRNLDYQAKKFTVFLLC